MKFTLENLDTSFISIVNPDTYNSYVNQDWQFEELMKHLKEESQNFNSLTSIGKYKSSLIKRLLKIASEKKLDSFKLQIMNFIL